MHRILLGVLGGLLITLSTFSIADARCSVSGCGGGGENWEESAQAFLNSDVPMVGSTPQVVAGSSFRTNPIEENGTPNEASKIISARAMTDYVSPAFRSGQFPNGTMLKALLSVSSSDVMVDVSNSDRYSYGEADVRGAIRIPAKSFLYENGAIKSFSELAKILGDAGISNDDRVVIYSDDFSSGEAAFVVWLMRYLGHEDVKALDGGLEDWKDASLPLETKQNARTPTNYTLHIRHELLSDYEYMKSGSAQVVDARSFQEYGKGRIPNAIFISPEQVVIGGKIKEVSELNKTFARVSRERPVVVYSKDWLGASMVWYALQLTGYDSRLYRWGDWQAHNEPQVYDVKDSGLSNAQGETKTKYKKLG